MIAVVVLTYNGRKYLADFFASLEKTECEEPWRVILVDNASTDDTRNWLSNYGSVIQWN